MTKTYVHQGALICDGCAALITDLVTDPKQPFRMEDRPTEMPNGPYADGGGEADTPQHCEMCRVFLENPLTTNGYHYLLNKLTTAGGDPAIRAEWLAFYGDDLYDGVTIYEHLLQALYEHARDPEEGGECAALDLVAEQLGVAYRIGERRHLHPGDITLSHVEHTYSMDDDDKYSVAGVLFEICAELCERSDLDGWRFIERMRYQPGAGGNHIETDSMYAMQLASATTADILAFAEHVEADYERLKAKEEE